ncbi:MAG TPA: aromatic amino acid transport family protein [Victivallales bacterium]|nr:aromatic amino acid transport family protein [Victivallales bacterium]
MNLKFIGGVLILIGTCIGGGLLALPVSTSPGGFISSIVIMICIWAITALGAFYILEIAQWLPPGVNIISMAKATLGKKAEILAWIIYLMLCYALLCAYISGGSDIFQYLINLIEIPATQIIAAVIFVLVLGGIIYMGVKSMDRINRVLMLFKFLAFFSLIVLIFPHIKPTFLLAGNSKLALSAVTVTVTSFGFAIVIPSLFDYFEGNVKKVKYIILCGTLIPLICYVVWNMVIMGTLPRTGNDGLMNILYSGNITSGLVLGLKHYLHVDSINEVSDLFTSICMLTSFLGVSLALFDFLADGLKISKKSTKGRLKIWFLTFIPPLLIVIFYPKMFVLALSYAGILVVILSILLPSFMVWNGRYKKGISKNYKVFGGKFILIFEIVLGFGVLIIGILESLRVLI